MKRECIIKILKDYCIYSSEEFKSITTQLSVLDSYILENHSRGIPDQYTEYITKQINIDISRFYLGSYVYRASIPVLVLRSLIRGLIIDDGKGMNQPILDPRQDNSETEVWIVEVINPESMKCSSRIHEKNIGPTLTQLRKDVTKLIDKLDILYKFLDDDYLNHPEDICEIVYGVTKHTFNECLNPVITEEFITSSSNSRSEESRTLTSGMRYELYHCLKKRRDLSEFPSSLDILLAIGRCLEKLVKENLLDEKTRRFIDKNKSRIDCVDSIGVSLRDLFDESFIKYYNESHKRRISIEDAIYLYDLRKNDIYIPSNPVNKFAHTSGGGVQIFYIPEVWRQTSSDDIRELENLIIQFADHRFEEENYLSEFFPGGHITFCSWGDFLEGIVNTLNQLKKLNPEWEKIVRENINEELDEKQSTYLLKLDELREQLSK